MVVTPLRCAPSHFTHSACASSMYSAAKLLHIELREVSGVQQRLPRCYKTCPNHLDRIYLLTNTSQVIGCSITRSTVRNYAQCASNQQSESVLGPGTLDHPGLRCCDKTDSFSFRIHLLKSNLMVFFTAELIIVNANLCSSKAEKSV